MKRKQSIAIDFDGVICDHKFPDVGEPTEGVKEALEKLRDAGYHIIIHSCRTSSIFKDRLMGDQVHRIKDYMKYYKLHHDQIWEPDKPVAVAYIDDKAIRFRNNWSEIADRFEQKSKGKR